MHQLTFGLNWVEREGPTEVANYYMEVPKIEPPREWSISKLKSA